MRFVPRILWLWLQSSMRRVRMWSWFPRDSDLRMTTLARPSSNCKQQRGCYKRTITTYVQLENTNSCRGPQGACRQDELIDGVPAVVTWLSLDQKSRRLVRDGCQPGSELSDSRRPVRMWTRKQRTLLGCVTRQRLVKTVDWEDLVRAVVWISVSAIVTCSYDP
jgi:hypothetical protein